VIGLVDEEIKTNKSEMKQKRRSTDGVDGVMRNEIMYERSLEGRKWANKYGKEKERIRIEEDGKYN
jgi:hypothetical protein